MTLVTHQRESLFGKIINGEMRMNELRKIVEKCWKWLSEQYPYVENDTYIVMPNHFHGILEIVELDSPSWGGSRPAPTEEMRPAPTEEIRSAPTEEMRSGLTDEMQAASTNEMRLAPADESQPVPIKQPVKIKPLGELIGAFKTVSAKQINLLRATPGTPVWQRNYYERIIRDDAELDATVRYILANPSRWMVEIDSPWKPHTQQ